MLVHVIKFRDNYGALASSAQEICLSDKSLQPIMRKQLSQLSLIFVVITETHPLLACRNSVT